MWVPLSHLTTNTGENVDGGDDGSGKRETLGRVHLLISSEPYGMTPKRNDIMAFESFV